MSPFLFIFIIIISHLEYWNGFLPHFILSHCPSHIYSQQNSCNVNVTLSLYTFQKYLIVLKINSRFLPRHIETSITLTLVYFSNLFLSHFSLIDYAPVKLVSWYFRLFSPSNICPWRLLCLESFSSTVKHCWLLFILYFSAYNYLLRVRLPWATYLEGQSQIPIITISHIFVYSLHSTCDLYLYYFAYLSICSIFNFFY